MSKMNVLLVLDNCDGLLGDDTMEQWQALLGRIMTSGAGVSAIVTSRHDVNAVGFEAEEIRVGTGATAVHTWWCGWALRCGAPTPPPFPYHHHV